MTDVQQAVPVAQEVPGEGWSDDWKAFGFNGAIRQAQEALRFLANNDRPSGGEQFPNSACCYMIADELEITRKRYAALARLTPIEGVAASGEAEKLADAVATALSRYAVAYTHVTLTDMSTAGRSWKVHETGRGNPFDHGVWLGEFDTKEAANAFCADLRRSAAISAAHLALSAPPATSPAIPEGKSGDGVVTGFEFATKVRDPFPQPHIEATKLALTATPETFPHDSYSLAQWLDKALFTPVPVEDDATQTREAEGLRLIIEKYVPLGMALDADTRAACIEDIVDDLAPLETDGRVKLVASALCRAAGVDPEGGARSGYSWINHEADARTLLAALNARGGA